MKKAKWTIIDTLIVIAVVVVAVVGVKMLGITSSSNTETVKREIVIMATDKDTGFADAVRVNERATISLTAKDGGIVTRVESEPNVIMTFDAINGTYQNVENEAKEDVYIYVDVECEEDEKAIKVGGTIVRVGEAISIRGKGYATQGHIVQINDGGDK